MKCSKHSNADAQAICIYCGVGLCVECAQKKPSGRVVCSAQCAQALAEMEDSLIGLRRKTLGGHRLTGYFCSGVGAGLLVFSALAGYNHQWDLLILQLPIALGLGICGFFYLRLANRN